MIAPEAGLSVSRQCTLLGIARSSFYYRPRPGSLERNSTFWERLGRIFTEHPVYGSRRLQVALLREGVSNGRRRIRRLMRKLGLWAVRPKRNTSQRHPEHKVYPYLLRGKTIDQPNQVWAADITYIPMRQGFLYLVAILDWATRRVLSWRLSNTFTAGFCVEALSAALGRFAKPGIFNTDHGAQFTSDEFIKMLRDHRFPHLAHRSAAAHKLHSATATIRSELDSGKGEPISRLPALAYSPRKLSKQPGPSQDHIRNSRARGAVHVAFHSPEHDQHNLHAHMQISTSPTR